MKEKNLLSNKLSDVKAESLNNYDIYTNSDNLIYDTDKTIFDYYLGDNPLYATKAKLVTKSAPYGYLALSGSEDDDIVQIVPKQLFKTVGENLEIGSEYGFYINTEDKGNYFASTVLAFDINLDYSNLIINNRIDLKVAPIFQYNYAYLKASESKIVVKQDLFNFNIDYSITKDTVIAIPSYVHYDLLGNVFGEDYNQINKYYLKDISMGITVSNEQELNYGDVGYNPYNDKGYFITGYDYTFNGGKYIGNKFVKLTTSDEDIVLENLNKASYVLGWMSFIPYVGEFIAPFAQLAATPGIIDSWYDNVKSNKAVEYNENDVTFTENGVGHLKIDAYAKNHDDQLANYVDENGKPCFIKAATIPFKRVMEGGVWYGFNDFAIGQFTINHSAYNQPANQTRLVNDIELKIMDSSTGEAVMFGKKTNYNILRDPAYKDIRVEQEQKLNLLPNGTNYFNFNAEYASDYTFNIPNANGIKVKVNGAVVNGSVSLNAGEHNVEIINLTDKKFLSYLKITSCVLEGGETNKALTINTNQTYILKAKTLSGVKKLCTNNQNIEIFELLTSNFEPYNSKGTISASSIITHPFIEGDYYIALRNKTNDVVEINLTIENNISTISLGTEQTLLMNGDNYAYFKFVAPEGGTYVITASDSSNWDVNVYDIDGNNVGGGLNPYYFHINFDSNKTYYISIKNGTYNSNNIVINKSENSFEFVLTNGNEVISTFKTKIQIARGKSYTLTFKINGKVRDDVYFEINKDVDISNYDFPTENLKRNIISFGEYSAVGGSGVVIDVKPNNLSIPTISLISLVIVPKINKTITINSIINAENLTVNVTATKYISEVKYKLYPYENEFTAKIDSYNVNNTNSVAINILENVIRLNITSPQDVQFHITGYTYKDIYDKPQNAKKSIKNTTPINTHFAGGDGTVNNYYTITTARHFRNIVGRNYYFYMLNDVNLGNIGTSFSLFNGKLSANFKKVTYALNVNGNPISGSVGLFATNYGKIDNMLVDVKISVEYVATTSFLNVGGIAGFNTSSGSINNCTVENEILMFRDYAQTGGIAGRNEGYIANCTNRVNIHGHGDIGGIAGATYGNSIITACSNYGAINYYDYDIDRSIGGIVGFMEGGKVYDNFNNSYIAYVGEVTSEREKTLKPNMAFVVGHIKAGEVYNNNYGGIFNSGSLREYTWRSGWFNEKVNKNNQLEHAGEREIGWDERP